MIIGYYDYTVVLTYISMLCGLLGIANASERPFLSLILLMVCGVCDMFDGKIARTKKNRTNNEKRFGIQIDSLSDLICFGVLPSIIGYNLGMKDHWYLIIICMIFTLNALIRLAYFNVEEEIRQDKSSGDLEVCTGLPVTPSAMIFPLTYLICQISVLEDYLVYIYAGVMLLVACLFIGNYHIFKKPKLKGVIIVMVIGLAILGLLIYAKCK